MIRETSQTQHENSREFVHLFRAVTISGPCRQQRADINDLPDTWKRAKRSGIEGPRGDYLIAQPSVLIDAAREEVVEQADSDLLEFGDQGFGLLDGGV